ncbi:DUF5688 family protein [Anaerosporobacter faecicola]|uniref:DUF5688 family protein n=1 Tax=Anaerosporobacter faecicola TaxID=2718714 RepID=UPI00143A67CF|nr:DUF5688 family protein [Anaerosporobacter faecicola]
MEYSEFIKQVKSCIEQRASIGYQVQLHTIMKNNDVERIGLVLVKEGARVTPTIYLDRYYGRYKRGETLEQLCSEMYDLRIMTEQEETMETLTANMDLAAWEDKIIYRLVNRKKNQKRLQNAPFMQFMDLAITFHCIVRNSNDEIGSFQITRELMERWNLTVKELYQYAGSNTPKFFPAKINTMEDVLQELMSPEEYRMIVEDEETKDVLWQQTEEEERSSPKMYILTNSNGINGASALLYPKVIEEFSNKIEASVYILPSSIHEVILVPFQEDIEKSQLIQMVNEVNETQVENEEVLSSNVYFYDIKQKELSY